MKTYTVYQQLTPTPDGEETITDPRTGKPKVVKALKSRLVVVGMVMASSGRMAIKTARETIKEFRMAPRNSLAAYPVVQDDSGEDYRSTQFA